MYIHSEAHRAILIARQQAVVDDASEKLEDGQIEDKVFDDLFGIDRASENLLDAVALEAEKKKLADIRDAELKTKSISLTQIPLICLKVFFPTMLCTRINNENQPRTCSHP